MIELKGTYNQDCKIFIDEVETEAIELVRNILNQEISAGVQVRIMPDTHVGKGIVIGFTMPVTRMVNPNYIGVDIGCSVTTFKLNQRIEEERFPTLDQPSGVPSPWECISERRRTWMTGGLPPILKP